MTKSKCPRLPEVTLVERKVLIDKKKKNLKLTFVMIKQQSLQIKEEFYKTCFTLAQITEGCIVV